MTELYRHFDAAGRLLYVGVSMRTVKRLGQHRRSASWYGRIARVEIERFPDRKAALAAERDAILAERPEFNISAATAADLSAAHGECAYCDRRREYARVAMKAAYERKKAKRDSTP